MAWWASPWLWKWTNGGRASLTCLLVWFLSLTHYLAALPFIPLLPQAFLPTSPGSPTNLHLTGHFLSNVMLKVLTWLISRGEASFSSRMILPQAHALQKQQGREAVAMGTETGPTNRSSTFLPRGHEQGPFLSSTTIRASPESVLCLKRKKVQSREELDPISFTSKSQLKSPGLSSRGDSARPDWLPVWEEGEKQRLQLDNLAIL